MSTSERRLRVALLGCGQIADAHLQEIARLPMATVEAVCDRYRDLAEQAAARFGVPRAYDNLDRMLDEIRPDVVHVTTPAHTHCELGLRLLQRDCHVYIEKPVTLNVAEFDRLLSAARSAQKCLTVGHDQLFDPIWLEARARVAAGDIGGVRHVESVLGYPLQGQFGSLVASDPGHWVRRLPGGLFHNTISHPLYRLTDLLPDEQLQVNAHWYARGSFEFPTELRVHLQGADASGSLLFDTGIESQRVTRIYGTAGLLEVDLDAQVIRRSSRARLPGAFGKIETPWRHWREGARNLRRNIGRFLRSDIHYFAGIGELCRRFYDSILHGGDPPIPYHEIRRVTALMDEIFDQCGRRAARVPAAPRNDSRASSAQSLYAERDQRTAAGNFAEALQ